MELKNMTIDEIEARKAEILTELEAPEADLDALEEEMRSIKDELETRKAEEAKKAEIRKAVAEGEGEVVKKIEVEERKTMTNAEVRNSAEYIEAFANYCKTGDDTECRSLLSDNAQNGVVPVPTFVGEIVAERLKASKILSRVRHMEAKGNVKIGFEISAPAAGTHTEGSTDPMPEEELALGIVTLSPVTLKKWVAISDEALDSMSGEEYVRYIYDEIARGIIKAREGKVIQAIDSAPQTATATSPAAAVYTPVGGTATLADFVNARALLSGAAEDLVIILSPSLYAVYKGLQFGANYGVDPFDGIEVIISEGMRNDIAFIGDLSGIMENLPKGDNIEFKYDDKSRMKFDLVDILGRLPVATGVVGNNFFARIALD